jgi:hypothetical protein
MNRIITLEDLTSRDACEEQVEKFKVAYPNGFEVTGENLLEARANGFAVLWTQCLLSDSALEVYKAARASALEAYNAVVAPAREVYDAVCASAWKTYEAARASALEDFDAVCVPAWEACLAVYTKALADALNGELA